MVASYYRLFKCHAAAVAFAVVFTCALGGPVEAYRCGTSPSFQEINVKPSVCDSSSLPFGLVCDTLGGLVDGWHLRSESESECPATAEHINKWNPDASYTGFECTRWSCLSPGCSDTPRAGGWSPQNRDACEAVATALNRYYLDAADGVGSNGHVTCYPTPDRSDWGIGFLYIENPCTCSAGEVRVPSDTKFYRCECSTGRAGPSCEYSNAETCNANGIAQSDGSCDCIGLFYGASCENSYSDEVTCNDAGTVQPDGSCICTDPTVGVGASCEYNNAATCNDAGTAQPDGSCVCADPTIGVGPSCEYSNADTCNANGIAQPDGSCDCTGLFYGPSCESGYSDAVTCRGAGAAQLDGSCECNGGFAGPNCQHSDAVTCSSRGVATDEGSCGCIESVFGANCEVARDTLCSGFGDPINEETCECDAGYMFVIASGTGDGLKSSSPGASLSSTCAPEPEPEEEPESIVLAAAVASSTSLFLLVCFYQQFIPKCCCIEWVLNKLGCLKSCEMSYPTEDDADSTKVMISTAAGRKLAEKFECLQPALELCMIGGPTGGDDADLPTALCAPATKLYRRVKCGCCPTWLESCCETHGPNPDESNENVMFVPGAPVAQAAKGLFEKVQCCQPVSSQGSDENETATMDATWESPGADYLEVENSN